jgi:hypothetical protein|nr:MAG TPA: hypothetical protein [Caudoviricetes sp.]
MNLYPTRNQAIEHEICDVLRKSEDVTGPIDEASDIYPDLFWEIVEKHAR